MKSNQKNTKNMEKDAQLKLFRTSTANLFDPVDCLEVEKVAAPVKTLYKHTPYFSAEAPEDFRIQDAEKVKIEDMVALSRPYPSHHQKTQRHDNQKTTNEHNKHVSPKNSKRKEKVTNNFSKIQNVLKQATNDHRNMKLKLQNIKNEQLQMNKHVSKSTSKPKNAKKEARSLTPSPRHCPPSPKYPITGNMTQRYNKRQAQLAQHTLELKLTKERQQLKECTFKPFLVDKAVSRRILAQRERKLHAQGLPQQAAPQGNSVFIKFQQRSSFDMPKRHIFQFEEFKTLIKYQLERVPLDKQR